MLAKATIINILTDQKVVCMFNPKEYTFAKSNKWEEKPAKGKSVAHLEFSGGAPANLKLQLLFDTFEDHPGVNRAGEDVRKLTAGLWDMMKISDKNKDPKTRKGAPPHVRFEWGTLWSFKAVIESISQKFVLFSDDGTPLRAILDVSFRQLEDAGQYPRQNPTSGGNPGEHVRTVREGERLSIIAFEEYGDPAMWRALAHDNAIEDPNRLRAGQTLIIRPRQP